MTIIKPIRAFDTFHTNIDDLPEGDYVTQTGYTDKHPWKVIASTATTLTIQEVLTERDPSWKPEIIPGGFAGHCTNQDEQRHRYVGLSDRTAKIRLRKSRYCGSDKLWANPMLGEFIANGAVEFYDYNF